VRVSETVRMAMLTGMNVRAASMPAIGSPRVAGYQGLWPAVVQPSS
jgi:hypothetical protein